MQVVIRDNNVDQALKALKKKMQREGIFHELKLRNYFEKPSGKRALEKAGDADGAANAYRWAVYLKLGHGAAVDGLRRLGQSAAKGQPKGR